MGGRTLCRVPLERGENTHRHQKLISDWVSLSQLSVQASCLSSIETCPEPVTPGDDCPFQADLQQTTGHRLRPLVTQVGPGGHLGQQEQGTLHQLAGESGVPTKSSQRPWTGLGSGDSGLGSNPDSATT